MDKLAQAIITALSATCGVDYAEEKKSRLVGFGTLNYLFELDASNLDLVAQEIGVSVEELNTFMDVYKNLIN